MMKRELIVIILIVLNGNFLYAQAPTPPVLTQQVVRPAYVDETVLKISGIRNSGEVNFIGNTDKITVRKFVDGLNRPLQDIEFGKGNVTNPDIVSFYVYDSFGNEKKKYLPYATNTGKQYQNAAISAQTAFYATSNPTGKYAKDDAAYSESQFDNSQINSLLKEGSAGAAWQLNTGKVKSNVTRTNTAADYVRQFNADGSSLGFWPSGSLIVQQLIDEDGQKTLTFTDKNNKPLLIRSWVDDTIHGQYKDYKDTYYVYHFSGQPVMMIPPNVVDRLKNNSWNLGSDDLNNNIFRYEYDEKGRLISKKSPSVGWTYMIYDKLDRITLVQKPEYRAANKWFFIKYDKLGRKVQEGILQDNSHTTHTLMQTYCDTYDYYNTAVDSYESRGGTQMGYSDSCFPQSSGGFSSFEVFTTYYYDSYDTDNNGTENYNYQNQGLGSEEPIVASSQGKTTVITSKKIGSNDWITKVYFYDKNGAIIQEQSNNVTNLAIVDVHTNVLDFVGLLKRSVKKKLINGVHHTTDQHMTYDVAGRLLSITHKYNSNTAVTIAEYVYNELGQLVDKNLGKSSSGNAVSANIVLGAVDAVATGQTKVVSASNSIILGEGFYAAQGSNFTASIVSSGYLQSVDYRYNIRGWLTGINNADLTTDGYNEESNDVFGMEFLYENSNVIGNSGLYNGHISGVKWRAKMNAHPFDNISRAYTYDYDKLGQLRNALFKGNNGGGWVYKNDAFSERNMSYDLNGNMLTLERNMLNLSNGSIIQMDNLSYNYKTSGGGDKLQQVNDAYGVAGSYGFKGTSTESEEYLYDEGGNLIVDKNKNATYSYNDLGKVDRLTLGGYSNRYIQYYYNGLGECLTKQVVDNGSTVSTTSYVSDFVVLNNVLSYITTAEGRIRTANGAGTYEYFVKDNLGNVRASFEDQGGVAKVRQENSYYALGLVHNATIVPSAANKLLYNDGSEWQDDFANDPDLYNTPLRQYDPVLGRFNGADLMAEELADFSSYSYAFNNPVGYNDPSGAYPELPPGTYYPGDPIFQQWMQNNWGLFNTGGTYEQYYGSGGYMLNEVTIYGWSGNMWGSDVFRTSSFDSWMQNALNPPRQDPPEPSRFAELQSGLSNVNTILNGLGFALDTKHNIIEYAVRNSFRSATSYRAFNALRPSQQAWRTTNVLGRTGAQVLKYSKVLGAVGAVASMGITATKLGVKYYEGTATKEMLIKSTIDVVMTGVGFLGPIGFGISATYFILDSATNGFGGYGKIE